MEKKTMAAAAADIETGGVPVSGKQSTTTTAQAEKIKYSRAARIAYRVGYVFGRVFGHVLCSLILLVLLILGAAVVWYLFVGVAHLLSRCSWPRPYAPVEYSVTIAAVSGLDPANDLPPHQAPASASASAALRRRLDPAFNLTLVMSSPRRALRRECVQAGTTVEVVYLGVPLATGPAPELCVDVGESREVGSVVAWGDGVRLPAFVLDNLAADVRRGAVEFGVKLRPPVPYCASRPMLFFSTAVDVVSCRAKAGGGPAPCRVSRETFSSTPLPHPGREREYSEANLAQPTLERRDTS